MTKDELARMIDHTLLRPDAVTSQIESLCKEAVEAGFATVCVQPSRVALAAKFLVGSGVGVASVTGFPQGANAPETKAFEAKRALLEGADEIDMVLNIGALLEGDTAYVRRDILAVREATRGHTLKVILETADCTEEQIIEACRLCDEAGCDFVKTSTGFGSAGATVDAVKIMRANFSGGIKASSGIRTLSDAMKMIEAGATRLGTSSGMAILRQMEGEDK